HHGRSERNDLAEAAYSGTYSAHAAGSAEAADGCASADSAVKAGIRKAGIRDSGSGIRKPKEKRLRRESRPFFCALQRGSVACVLNPWSLVPGPWSLVPGPWSL